MYGHHAYDRPVRRAVRTLVRWVTRVLAPALLDERANRVERGPIDAQVAHDIRDRRRAERAAGTDPKHRA